MIEEIAGRAHYAAFIILFMLGLYGMIVRRNLVRKLLACGVFQTAIILFYVSLSPKWGAAAPILDNVPHDGSVRIDPDKVHNPLPHVLMLTAIVVSVCTTGVALAILLRVYSHCGTLEEDEILEHVDG